MHYLSFKACSRPDQIAGRPCFGSNKTIARARVVCVVCTFSVKYNNNTGFVEPVRFLRNENSMLGAWLRNVRWTPQAGCFYDARTALAGTCARSNDLCKYNIYNWAEGGYSMFCVYSVVGTLLYIRFPTCMFYRRRKKYIYIAWGWAWLRTCLKH